MTPRSRGGSWDVTHNILQGKWSTNWDTLLEHRMASSMCSLRNGPKLQENKTYVTPRVVTVRRTSGQPDCETCLFLFGSGCAILCFKWIQAGVFPRSLVIIAKHLIWSTKTSWNDQILPSWLFLKEYWSSYSQWDSAAWLFTMFRRAMEYFFFKGARLENKNTKLKLTWPILEKPVPFHVL